MVPPVVAVIDLGSNSIKSLAATRDAGGGLTAVQMDTLDARIGTGVGQAQPRLTEEGMRRGVEAVRELLHKLASLAPARTVLVATSAVRDAANGREFGERIRAATGQELRVLDGGEEARLIGRGLTTDPMLAGWQDFYVFDLGGGSLECLAFRAGLPEQVMSLPLGCVRLTEQGVKDPRQPFNDQARNRVAEICREVIAKSGFHFALPAAAEAVFTGGTVTTARAILAARAGQPITETSAVITVETLRSLLDNLARLPLSSRQKIPGLPAARADVFPAALATVITVAEMGGFTAFRHSFHNLRWGLAAELLG